MIISERYDWVEKVVDEAYCKNKAESETISDRIDKIVTHRYLALPIFFIIMSMIFYLTISSLGGTLSKWIEEGLFKDGFSIYEYYFPSIPKLIGDTLGALQVSPLLISLVIDGMVSGVGAVLHFIPQMVILFSLLGLLEASGYMARVAFILDRLFRKFGLSGKSFIPLLVSMGCGVPGVLATRTIESERERKITIITATFVPCGAKIPLIALIAARSFNGAWWVTSTVYFIAIASIVVSGIILTKSNAFRGNPSPFVLELPEYRLPRVKAVVSRMWEQVKSFVLRAGSVILITSVVLWFLSKLAFIDGALVLNNDIQFEQTILADLGGSISFIFEPLGFGHSSAVIASLMGLIAKEEIVAVFGVLGFEQFTAASAFAFMIFNLLCAPCFAAIAAVRQEMKSIKWTIFTVMYQTVFAYGMALMIYQFSSIFTGKTSIIGLISAIVSLFIFLFFLFRPVPKSKNDNAYILEKEYLSCSRN